jgi:hypothetical protein
MISLAEAMRDQQLLGDVFAAESFWPWHAVAKLISGEGLDDRETELFRQCTGRTKLPSGPVKDLTFLAGRRSGKDRFMSGVGVHRAALAADWSKTLSAGEQGVVILIGNDKKQAKILRRYCKGLLAKPMLAKKIARETDEVIEFKNGAALEVVTNDADLVRGRSVLALLGTEACFWRTDPESSSSDEEVVGAAEPGMAMTPGGGLMILASSVHRKKGLMYRLWKELHGNNEAEAICWLASSRTMNPAMPEHVVAKAKAKDLQRANAEFDSIWREDVSDFIPGDVVDAVTDFGVLERPPIPGMTYAGFADPAGGTGRDSFSIAIAHSGPDGEAVLDCIRERPPRFVPAAVVKEYSDLLRSYRVSSVRSDRYASAWAGDEWARNGITCTPSELTKSEIYLACLPLLLSAQARLLDNERLREQFKALERRTHAGGRESIGPAPGAQDDVSNAVAGVVDVLLTGSRGYDSSMSWISGPDDEDDDGPPMIRTPRGNGRAQNVKV